MDVAACTVLASAGGESEPDPILLVVVMGVVMLVSLVGMVFALRRMLHIVAPGQLLVVTGRRTLGPDGRSVGYRLVFGPGRVVHIPFLERVDVVDLTPLRVVVASRGARALGGAPVTVRFSAAVAISREPSVAMRAVERFLGRSRSEVQQAAEEALDAACRAFVAERLPEQLDARDEELRAALQQACSEPCGKLGLAVEELKLEKLATGGGGIG